MPIAVDIDVMLARRGNAAHIEARVRSGWGSPATRSVLWPRPRRDTRFFDRMFTSRITPPHGLPRRSVTPREGRP